MPRQIVSPSPDPRDLVVKNGSKMLAATVSEIPGPVSETSITMSGTPRVCLRVILTVSAPSLPIASIA